MYAGCEPMPKCGFRREADRFSAVLGMVISVPPAFSMKVSAGCIIRVSLGPLLPPVELRTHERQHRGAQEQDGRTSGTGPAFRLLATTKHGIRFSHYSMPQRDPFSGRYAGERPRPDVPVGGDDSS